MTRLERAWREDASRRSSAPARNLLSQVGRPRSSFPDDRRGNASRRCGHHRSIIARFVFSRGAFSRRAFAYEIVAAGLPTLICPFFGDQMFWATRVQKLGAGIRVNSLSQHALTAALKKGSESRAMRKCMQLTEDAPSQRRIASSRRRRRLSAKSFAQRTDAKRLSRFCEHCDRRARSISQLITRQG